MRRQQIDCDDVWRRTRSTWIVGQEVIKSHACKLIGGDKQRIATVSTEFTRVTFKHVLLPVYVGAYRINSKIYHVVINGRTGELQGKRPWSWIKITALVLVSLILFTVLIMRIRGAMRIF